MKTIVLLSGGLDSTVLLTYCLSLHHEVKAIGFDYGQRHRRELESALAVARSLGVEFTVADLSALKPVLAGSSQTSDDIDVPFGHYAEETMKATVVPNRNMLMLAVAGAWAISSEFEQVAYAAHAGDHPIYPDCRPGFVDALSSAMQLAHWHGVNIFAPFINRTKAEIVRLGNQLAAPLDLTWSCYVGGEKHCKRCGTCVERVEAFQLAGVIDPTVYEQ